MATMQLALRISGTKQRMAGFAPLVNIGMLPEEIGANMDRVPAFSESPAFILRHSREFICYLLLDRNVKSFDADANGVLSIALAISRDARLAGGQSPYSLLMRVYEAFRSHYMSPQGDGRYSFINQDIEDTVFREIVRGYPLEARVGPYVMMRDVGSPGIISVPPSNLEAFFRDTQYDEFRLFREIQIGTKCQTTPGLETLEIPHRPKFMVYLNGQPTNYFLKEPYERFKIQGSVKEDFEYAGTDFSLQDVLEAPEGVLSREEATIRLDFNENRIYCDLIKKEIWYNLIVELPANEEKRRYLRDGAMRGDYTLYFGQENITSQIVSPTQILFKASSCKMNQPKLSGRTRDSLYFISCSKQLSTANREVKVLLNATPAPKPVSQYNPSARPANDRYGASRMHEEEEEEPMNRYPEKKKGFDVKSILLGFLAGLCLGALCMGLVGKLLKFQRVPKGKEVVESEMRDKWQKDSAAVDSLKALNGALEDKIKALEEAAASNQNRVRTPATNPVANVPSQGAGGPSQAVTPALPTGPTTEQLDAIMGAIRQKVTYDKIKLYPGFSSLKPNQRRQIEWLLNAKSYCRDKNGKFAGDSRIDFDKSKASKILDLREGFYEEGVFTLNSIQDYYSKLMSILTK